MGRLRRLRFRTRQPAEFQQRRTDVVQMALFRDIDTQMQPFQLCPASRRGSRFPQHDQRRPQFQHALDIQGRRLADARNARDGRRIIARIIDAHHPIACARRKQQFRDMRAQTDDSGKDFRGGGRSGRVADAEHGNEYECAQDGHVGMDYNARPQFMGR